MRRAGCSSESCRRASARSFFCSSVPCGYSRSSDRIVVVTTSAKTDRILDCNEALLATLGCGRDEVIGQPPTRFAAPVQPGGVADRKSVV